MPIKGLKGGIGSKALGYGLGAAEEATDAEFNQTVLLLHGDGTNGEQNNTFIDSSTSSHTITRNGDTTQGTFSPFSLEDGYWSNSFDGTSNGAVTITPTGTETDLSSTVSFTIQFWIYPRAVGQSSNSEVFSRGRASTYAGYRVVIPPGVSTIGFALNYNGTGASVYTVSSTSLSLNEWTHVAITRESNTMKIYLNGVLDATNTGFSGNPTMNAADVVYLGRGSFNTTNRQFDGLLSNFELIRGSVLYNSNFTVPTEPSTAIADTTLLTCQSNRFVDNSTTGHTLANSSGAKIQPFSPLAPSRSYSKDAVGGSAYFDNNGDYLETATSNSLDFNANQFCIEWWEYRTARSSFDTVMHIGFNGSTAYGLVIGYNGNLLYWSSNGTSWNVLSAVNFFGSETRYNNQWYHCVLTRDSSNQFRSFINGVLRYTTSVSTNIIYQAANAIAIGSSQSHSTNQDYEGYLSSINISNGSIPSRYQTSSTTVDTSIFTPPTAPTTSDTDTVLLLNFTNAGIIDHTMKNNLETEGDAQIDTSVKKFGTGSIYFDGIGDELRIPSSELFNFTGDFTIEFWIYKTESTTSGQYDGILYRSTDWRFKFQQSDNVINYDNGTDAQLINYTGSPAMLNNWHHIAFVRNGSTLTGYVDGTSYGSVTESGAFTATADLLIGENGTDHLGGYIDELRITKGVARYTSNFTAPTKAFANR